MSRAILVLASLAVGYDCLGREATLSEWTSFGTLIVTAILCLLTAIYVVLTFRLATLPQRQINAELLLSLRTEFSAPEMLAAMKSLAGWKHRHQDCFAQVFSEYRKCDYAQVKDVDVARRMFKGYFQKLSFLLDEELTTDRFVKTLISPLSVGLLVDVVEPLETAINPNHDRSPFKRFRAMYAEELARGEGRIIDAESSDSPAHKGEDELKLPVSTEGDG